MTTHGARPCIPPAAAFRGWLAFALKETKQRPATVSRAIGASVNSVGAFLRDETRDITLSRASAIELHLRRHAAERGHTLPRVVDFMTDQGAGGSNA